jgi:flagellar biosynthesis/type III secretory pathway chaperone
MNTASRITAEADSLLGLLIAQCDDLEALLALSRRETAAAEARDFEEIIRLTAARATLGERLEVYHRQIAEMRQQLGAAADSAIQSPVATRIAELVNGVLAQDDKTRPLLMTVRQEAAQERKQLEQTQRSLAAYLSDGRMPAVACDQLA